MKSTVLLVDDDPLDLKSVQFMLESWDLETLPCRSGREALDKLATTPVDLVVSDLRMPEMTGDQLVQEVAKTRPGLPVVLVTADADVKTAVHAMRVGAFDYVLKPPDEEEFRLTLDRALEHSRLRRENEFLRAELGAGGMYGERLVGRSPAMLEVYALIQRVAASDSTVLIHGETGTGKELVAQTIHYKSRRADKPFIALNCAAINRNLIESELFGHEKGAFTGATTLRRGRFEDADGGTLFLDEIAETELEFQSKLLRVLQESEFERVGGNRRIHVDVRVLVSTNRDLQAEVREGRFREDLFYRLNVIPIRLPSLKERRGDIPLLAAHFADFYGRRYRNARVSLTPAAMESLAAPPWPGNVRELQHAVERAVVLAPRDTLGPEDLQMPEARSPAPDAEAVALQAALDQKTREHVLAILDRTGWRKQDAADLLGIDRATLYRILKKFRLESE